VSALQVSDNDSDFFVPNQVCGFCSAPFGLFYHSSWFTQPHHKEGFMNFLDTIMNMPEVWLVTNWQAIQWARDPTPISRLNQFTPFGCDYPVSRLSLTVQRRIHNEQTYVQPAELVALFKAYGIL